MKAKSFRRLPILFVLAGFAVCVVVGESSGLEIYTVGEAIHSWKDIVWDEADPGAAVGTIDFKTQPESITIQRIAPTENIALRTYASGGKVTVPNVPLSVDEKRNLQGIVCGDHTIALEMKSTPAKEIYALGVLVRLDLGARFGVNRIRFYPRMSEVYPFENDFMRSYAIFLNDGTEETSIEGMPIFQLVQREEKNSHAVVDVNMGLQYVRYIQIKSLTRVGWEIDEIEVHGAGFVPEATYQSYVFDFGDIATLGNIWWSQRKTGNPGASRIIVRTRTGNDPTPLVYYRKLGSNEEVEVGQGEYEDLRPQQRGEIRYFAKDGKEISKRDYQALPDGQRGEIKYCRIGGEVPFDKEGRLLTKASYQELSPAERGSIVLDREHGWSGWAAPYDYEEVQKGRGVPIVSPSPCQYFQFRVDLSSQDPGSAGSVDSLSFEYSRPPVAHQIVAEIAPRKVHPGKVTTFTYAVRSDIRGNDTGFDRLEIVTPTPVDSVESIKIDHQEIPFELVNLEADHFTVGFMRITDAQVLTVVFRAVVLRYGTLFEAKAFDSVTKELKQSVVAGDATPEISTNDIFVKIDLGKELIRSFKVFPNPLTPNDDGINDGITIQYNLLQLNRRVPLEVSIYDLAGSTVRSLWSGKGESGIYSMRWDGKDDRGNIVPPGLYIIRLNVDTDSDVGSKAKTVSVVY